MLIAAAVFIVGVLCVIGFIGFLIIKLALIIAAAVAAAVYVGCFYIFTEALNFQFGAALGASAVVGTVVLAIVIRIINSSDDYDEKTKNQIAFASKIGRSNEETIRRIKRK